MKNLFTLLFVFCVFLVKAQVPVQVSPASGPNLCDGSATIIMGNVDTSSISWFFPNSTTVNGQIQITNLCPGTYGVYFAYFSSPGVIDSLFFSFVVGPTNSCAGLTAIISTTPASSNTACDGALTASATGGTAPYVYLWSNNTNSSNLSNQCPGAYCVTVTDANGCVSSTCDSLYGSSSPSGQGDTLVLTNNVCNPSNSNGTLVSSVIDCNLDYSLVNSGFMTSYISYYPDSALTTWTLWDSLNNAVAVYGATYYFPPNTNGCFDLIFVIYCDSSGLRPTTIQSNVNTIFIRDVIYFSPTSVQNLAQDEIYFNNPIQDNLTIQGIENTKTQVQILNQLGQLMYRNTILQNTDINTSNWSNGIYYLQIENESGSKTHKLIKN